MPFPFLEVIKMPINLYKTYTNMRKLNEDTRYLSRSPARFEVHYISRGKVKVQVRCRMYSKNYCLAKALGYEIGL